MNIDAQNRLVNIAIGILCLITLMFLEVGMILAQRP